MVDAMRKRLRPGGQRRIRPRHQVDRPLCAQGPRPGARSRRAGVQVADLVPVVLRGCRQPHMRGDDHHPANRTDAARLRREDRAGALCAAGEALAGRAVARGAGRRARRRSACRRSSARCACSSSGTGSMCAASRASTTMTSVSKDLRAALDEHFTLERPEVVAEQVSVDGTRKWLLRLPGEHAGERPHEVECVYIPDTDRGTCASRARSAARSPARSATPARSGWCAISPPARSSAR